MPRQKIGDIRERYAGLIDFLNTDLNPRNWRQAINHVVGVYAGRRGKRESQLAIAIDRDLGEKEARQIQTALRLLFQHERPQSGVTLDAMQAVWYVAAALMHEHSGLRRCSECPDYFLPREGQETCGKRKCVDSRTNRLRARPPRGGRWERICPVGTCDSLINHAGPHVERTPR